MVTGPTLTCVSIAPVPVGLRVCTRKIADPGRLIDLLPSPDDPLCWVRDGDGLVGWGEVARFTTSGPGRFAEADEWWRSFTARLDVRDEVGLPGTGPVAFASFTFSDSSPGSVMVVPRVVVGKRDGLAWITEFAAGDGPGAVHQIQPVRHGGPLRYVEGRLSVSAYRRAVAEAIRRMRRSEVRKVVLAHDLLAIGDEPFDPRSVLAGLADRYPSCWSFAVEGLVGATPELLVRRTGHTVGSRVLAGTAWPEHGDHDDHIVRLLDSGKNREEHALAVASLAATLEPFCTRLVTPDAPSIINLPNVSHLASDVTGWLHRDRPAGLLRLAEAVHPTAAVGGTPRMAALTLITELEGMDRGRYAGPVGWVDANGDGELGVALRCAQFDGTVARLFAGCGIMPESDPDTEVDEAAAKLAAMRDALKGVD